MYSRPQTSVMETSAIYITYIYPHHGIVCIQTVQFVVGGKQHQRVVYTYLTKDGPQDSKASIDRKVCEG